MSEQAARFERVSNDFLAHLTTVSADQWDAPTPCPKWNVREVVAHVINEHRRTLATVRQTEIKSLYGVRAAGMGEIPELEPTADLVAAWQEIADGLVVAIDDPACADVAIPTVVGPLPFSATVEALPVDVLIHTWDLARATGGDDQLDQEAVVHVFEQIKPLDEALRQPWAFGPKVTPPAGADVQTQFLGFVGRDSALAGTELGRL